MHWQQRATPARSCSPQKSPASPGFFVPPESDAYCAAICRSMYCSTPPWA